MLYKKVSTDLDFLSREEEVLKFWKDNNIFELCVKSGSGKTPFTFYDGPPTANGKPHIGHILTRSIKDLIPRYQTMKGKDVLRKAGWDTHGLPVELEVEKMLGLDGKEQIEEYGVEPFIDECKKSVWKYKKDWEVMSDRVGFFADMQNPYVTYEDDYIESVWWSLSEIDKKGLLYKGHKVVPYCPRCGTALSSHEVGQGYKDVVETSIYVKFEIKNRENAYFLAWTTTPWTLPSNVALCVNPDEIYAEIEHEGQTLILAKALLCEVIGEGNFKIIKEHRGRELEYTEYNPLYDFGADKKAWFITCDNFVTLSDGTGIVHIAPAFGEDDANVGKNYDLPFVQMVNAQGKFKSETPWFEMFCKDADKKIIEDLDKRTLLFSSKPYEHSYPYCWRCNTPLLYYARRTWFIAMSKIKDKLVDNNRKINWYPENIKEGRMGNFVENVIDWGLSRERYWGTPLPVWECECGNRHVIGSRRELIEKGQNVDPNIELHKPFIDKVKLTCEKCGASMSRVPEVIDCWYDSGSMPFAQWHYPFENKEIFEQRYPADFISEAVDQTRGWFYTLLAIATLLFDEPPFKNCIVLGHVQDKDGQKMSKTKGNAVDPFMVLDKQGADAVRWYFYSNSAPWLPNRFYQEAVSESQRKFMGTLLNTYAFYILYANIDSYDPTKFNLSDCTLSVMDKWVLSRLNSLVEKIDDNLSDYKITESARELNQFTDELSNWYVRRCRERFWGGGMSEDKCAAFTTLYNVLHTFIRLCAPFIPFLCESIYQNLVRSVDKSAPLSVHLCEFPVADKSYIDKALEKNMDDVLNIVALGRAARNSANIKNRQPIANLYIGGVDKTDEMYDNVIKEELNVKQTIYNADLSDYITYLIKPQLKTLGPKYGKKLNEIRTHLQNCNGTEVFNTVKDGNPYVFEIGGEKIELYSEDLLIEPLQKEGFCVETDKTYSVILDINLTPELIEEGVVRELISKIQTMRKDAGFEVTDHIEICICKNEYISGILEKNSAVIMKDTLCDNISDTCEGYTKEWNINSHDVVISVRKI